MYYYPQPNLEPLIEIKKTEVPKEEVKCDIDECQKVAEIVLWIGQIQNYSLGNCYYLCDECAKAWREIYNNDTQFRRS